MAIVSVIYPGVPVVIPSARHLVRDVLAKSPCVDDLELIASEFMTNAIWHTASGQPGGVFTLTIHVGARWASIEVTDTGDGSWQHELESHEHGRGLSIIAILAERFGDETDESGRTVWAEVRW